MNLLQNLRPRSTFLGTRRPLPRFWLRRVVSSPVKWSKIHCLSGSFSVAPFFSNLMSRSSLTHFVKSIPEASVSWSTNDPTELTLDKACGDIVQAVQALKELRPRPTCELETLLLQLRGALTGCQAYCCSNALTYPFTRALLQVNDVLLLFFPSTKLDQTSVTSDPRIDISVDSAVSRRLEHVQLGPLRIPRLFNGLWQMSSPAWGSASSHKQVAALGDLVRFGLLATDMADHYVRDCRFFFVVQGSLMIYGDLRVTRNSSMGPLGIDYQRTLGRRLLLLRNGAFSRRSRLP